MITVQGADWHSLFSFTRCCLSVISGCGRLFGGISGRGVSRRLRYQTPLFCKPVSHWHFHCVPDLVHCVVGRSALPAVWLTLTLTA